MQSGLWGKEVCRLQTAECLWSTNDIENNQTGEKGVQMAEASVHRLFLEARLVSGAVSSSDGSDQLRLE